MPQESKGRLGLDTKRSQNRTLKLTSSQDFGRFFYQAV